MANDTEASDTQRHFLDRAETFYQTVVKNPAEYRASPRKLSEIYLRIALINKARRKPEKAAAAFEAAIAIQEKLLSIDPYDLLLHHRLASTLNIAGVVYDDLGQADKAESSYRKSQQHHRQLAEEEPGEAKHRFGIAHTLVNLANVLVGQGRLADAEQLLRDAKKQYTSGDKNIRRSGQMLNYLKTDLSLARTLQKQQKYDEATKLATSALRQCELRLLDAGDDRNVRELQADIHGELAEMHVAQEQYEKAVPHLRRQLQISVMLMAAQRDPYTFTADMLFRSDPSLSGKEQPQRWVNGPRPV